MELQHIWMEENKVANFFINLIFYFAGTIVLTYQSIQQIPDQEKALIQLDAQQIPNVRIKKMQNSRGITEM